MKKRGQMAPPATPIDPTIRGSIYFRRAVKQAMKYMTRAQAEEQVAASIQRGAIRAGVDVEDVIDELDRNDIEPPPGMPTKGRIAPSVAQLASKMGVSADEADRQVQALARFRKISADEAVCMLLSPDAGKRFDQVRVSTNAAAGDFVTEAKKLATQKGIRIDQAMSRLAIDRPGLHETFIKAAKR